MQWMNADAGDNNERANEQTETREPESGAQDGLSFWHAELHGRQWRILSHRDGLQLSERREGGRRGRISMIERRTSRLH